MESGRAVSSLVVTSARPSQPDPCRHSPRHDAHRRGLDRDATGWKEHIHTSAIICSHVRRARVCCSSSALRLPRSVGRSSGGGGGGCGPICSARTPFVTAGSQKYPFHTDRGMAVSVCVCVCVRACSLARRALVCRAAAAARRTTAARDRNRLRRKVTGGGLVSRTGE